MSGWEGQRGLDERVDQGLQMDLTKGSLHVLQKRAGRRNLERRKRYSEKVVAGWIQKKGAFQRNRARLTDKPLWTNPSEHPQEQMKRGRNPIGVNSSRLLQGFG